MTGRTCSRCKRPAAARGLCFTHHQTFLRQNPGAKLATINENTVLAAMPGTVADIMKATEMDPHTVGRILKRLRAAEKSHIGGHEPPHSKGCKWVVVHHAGPGKDAVLSERTKKAFRLQGEAMMQERRNAKRRAKRALIVGWAAPLMVGMTREEMRHGQA